MLEVFTIGGGEYLVNVFNAVAAWTGGGGYRSLLRVVMVMGLIYTLLVVAFTLNWRAWFNWFLQATLMYGVLMVPTVDLRITDRLNPSLAPATVGNVPLGLGVLASFTSQVGDYLTRTSETVFVMPSELQYSSNGMIYGSRLFDATRNFQIRDAEFATNLDEHFRKCVFGDIMLYQKSLTTLAEATNLWAAIGPGSPARAQKWIERSGSGTNSVIVTCRQAYTYLNSDWTQMLEDHSILWGKQLYPKLLNAAAAAKLKRDIPIVNAAFTGGSGSYADNMRQNTAINAFLQARAGMAGGAGGTSIDSFAQTRADIQARNTYNSIAQQAMTWVPILHIVLTVVFFAMFPVVFPLFLIPQTGVQTLKGYVTGFFYLAAWGPIYVVLHMICMNRGQSAARGIAEGGITLASFDGVGAVNAETATIAGFMLMSVPFLAAGMARGAMSIAGHSMSMLAPAQNAAEQAANEQTTGNYAYGNVSWANQTSNMRQSDQWSTAPSFSTGAAGFSIRRDNGTMSSSFGDGQWVDDMSNAISRYGVTPTSTEGLQGNLTSAASRLEREADSKEQSVSQGIIVTNTNRSSQSNSLTSASGFSSGRGMRGGTNIDQSLRTSDSMFNGEESRSGIGWQNSRNLGVDQGLTQSDLYKGSLGLGSSTGVSKMLPPGKGRGLGGAAGQITTGTGFDRNLNISNGLNNRLGMEFRADQGYSGSDGSRHDQTYALGASQNDGTYFDSGIFNRSESSSTTTNAQESALTEQAQAMAQARQMREQAQEYRREAAVLKSNGLQLSENLSNELGEFYRSARAELPVGVDAPELWATHMTDQQRALRDQIIGRWMESKREAIEDRVDDLIHGPDLVNVKGPSVGSADDVRALYRPMAVGGAQSTPDLGDPSIAPEVIAEGAGRIFDKQEHSDRVQHWREGKARAIGSAVRKGVDGKFSDSGDE